RSVESGELEAAVRQIEKNPLLRHIDDKRRQIAETLQAASRHAEREPIAEEPGEPQPPTRSRPGRDLFLLLDVSSRADQMGVSLGLAVERDERGDVTLRQPGGIFATAPTPSSGFALEIMNMDVVTTAKYLRAVTLPQISWEPLWNIPLPFPDPPASPSD